jgi:hypothetical protein
MVDLETNAGDRQTPMAIVRWKTGKRHVSQDGIRTACGHLVPTTATRTSPTPDWYEHTNCYNCAYRLWPDHGPAGYVCPTDGRDFPIQRACPHGRRKSGCTRCTPTAPSNWPCPNGCTDPADHDPMYRRPVCAKTPERKPTGPDGRCIGGCESIERATRRVNPNLLLDLADSAMFTCFSCSEWVCVECQTAPVQESLMVCDRCARSWPTPDELGWTD